MFEHNPADKIPQLEAMRMGVDYHLTVKVRGFTITLRPLAIIEQQQVAATVVEKYNMLPAPAKNRLTENLITAKETLMIASTTDVGTGDPKITDYILDRMTDGEVQFLWKQYMSACDRVNPVLDELPIEKLEELVNEVKKNPETLLELSFSEVINVCRHLTKGD